MAHAGWGTLRFKQTNSVCGHVEAKHYAKGLCRSCYRNQPEFLAMRHRYYLANKHQFQAKTQRAKHERRKQQKAYGITTEQWYQMNADQGGVCKICKAEPHHRKSLAVDHCHATGKIRGLLCDRCNQGLGSFKDDVSLMLKAIEYLNASH